MSQDYDDVADQSLRESIYPDFGVLFVQKGWVNRSRDLGSPELKMS